MALKVKAVERLLKFTKNENNPGVYRYGNHLLLGSRFFLESPSPFKGREARPLSAGREGRDSKVAARRLLAEGLEQAFLLSLSDGDDGAVTGRELALRLGVLDKLESLQILRTTELVVVGTVAVVHDYPRTSVDGLAHADAFHRFLRLLYIALQHLPFVGQLFGNGLIDATAGLLLIEEVVELVSLVEDDVAVDGGIAGIEEPLGLALQVGEVLVGVLVVNLVVGVLVAGAQGVEDHVLFSFVVVDGLRCPDADDVLPRLRVACGEIDGGVLPVDEVGTLQQDHASVACPSQARLHVRHHHVEGLAVLATEDVGVADTLCQGDGVALDDGPSLVQRRVVVAVVAQGVANLLVLGCVAVEIGEEVGHHLALALRLALGGFLSPRRHSYRQQQECRQNHKLLCSHIYHTIFIASESAKLVVFSKRIGFLRIFRSNSDEIGVFAGFSGGEKIRPHKPRAYPGELRCVRQRTLYWAV